MPPFHFYFVTDDDRTHIVSVELPTLDAVIPIGIKLTKEILAGVIREYPGVDEMLVQAVDDTGAVIYNFRTSPGVRGHDGPSDYLH